MAGAAGGRAVLCDYPRVRGLWLAALILCALPGCGRYGWIGASAQAPFRRCICSHPSCTPRQAALAEEYAAARDRAAWLSENGCDAEGNSFLRFSSTPRTVCRQEPRYESRFEPLPHERVATGCAECTEPMLCVTDETIGETCRAMSEDEWAAWRESRTTQIEIGRVTRCEQRGGAPGAQPASYGGGGRVHVRGYHRRDGTYVRPHTRSRPR
jgi:hypothetical protein